MKRDGNPFAEIREVKKSQELLDIAFSKAMKIKPPGSKDSPLNRSRNHELNRINTAANVLSNRLEGIIENFPSLDMVHPFYYEMCDLLIGVDELKISLGRINGTIEQIRNLQMEISSKLASTYHKKENQQLRKQAFGRFSSLIYQISNNLDKLEETRESLANIPGFNPALPTIVISGVPNVGKSSFIKAGTTGKPEVASYPFTTKEINFGHRELNYISIQFVDTPGLLDRSLENRNKVELQALLALKYLSDVILFLVDPTEEANCSLDEQFNLLHEILDFYPSIAYLIVITKVDMINDKQLNHTIRQIKNQELLMQNVPILRINTQDQTDVDRLIEYVEKTIKEKVLSTSKFKYLTYPEIAEDQLHLEEEDEIY